MRYLGACNRTHSRPYLRFALPRVLVRYAPVERGRSAHMGYGADASVLDGYGLVGALQHSVRWYENKLRQEVNMERVVRRPLRIV